MATASSMGSGRNPFLGITISPIKVMSLAIALMLALMTAAIASASDADCRCSGDSRGTMCIPVFSHWKLVLPGSDGR